MPQIKKIGKQIVADNTEALAILEKAEKRKRGRPPGTKNKPKIKVKKVAKGTETDIVYRYYFIADACGCRIGVNVIGSGMWCEHKNSMHLEDRKKYSEVEYTGM